MRIALRTCDIHVLVALAYAVVTEAVPHRVDADQRRQEAGVSLARASTQLQRLQRRLLAGRQRGEGGGGVDERRLACKGNSVTFPHIILAYMDTPCGRKKTPVQNDLMAPS